jgi:hypothetical protein
MLIDTQNGHVKIPREKMAVSDNEFRVMTIRCATGAGSQGRKADRYRCS